MFDEGNAQISAVGFFNPMLGGGDAVSAFGGGAGGMGGCFDISNGKIINCVLLFGRQQLSCPDTTLPILAESSTPTGIIYAEVTHSKLKTSGSDSSSTALSVKHDQTGVLPVTTLEKTYRALYYASGQVDRQVWIDVRFEPALFAMN